jgi:outer membrane protein W
MDMTCSNNSISSLHRPHGFRFRRIVRAATCGLALLALTALAARPAGAQTATDTATDTGFRARIFGASVNSVTGTDFDSATGYGAALEYRATKYLGFELVAYTNEIKGSASADFFDIHLDLESKVQMTPILAQLDLHLTPDSRVDLHAGPIFGWVKYGDFKTRVVTTDPAGTFVEHQNFATHDHTAFGAHLDVDVPFGGGRHLLTAGVTYLKAKVKIDAGPDEPEGSGSAKLEPLVVKVGYGFRF